MRNEFPILLAVLAALGLILPQTGCEPTAATPQGARPSGAPPRPDVHDAPEGQSESGAASPGEQDYGGRIPGLECMTNRWGIRKKVIITKVGARCVDSPASGRPTGPTLQFFLPYFVFSVFPEGKNEEEIEFFQIGPTPRKSSIRGWVSRAHAAPWDTRVGARYRRVAGARIPPLLIYRSKRDLLQLVKTGESPNPPIARAVSNADTTWSPWPIAETCELEFDGRLHALVRLSFLGEYKQNTDLAKPETARQGPGYTRDELARIQANVKKLDIVYCLDSTLSTTPFVKAIRDAVTLISSRLQEMEFRPDIGFGLVLYRDYVDAIMFNEGLGRKSVTKTYPLDANFDKFLQQIKGISPTTESSEDYPEAVYDGCDAALRTAWRGEGLSARVVVLIGDNSAHEPGSRKNPRNISPEALIRKASDARVTIFGLCVKGGGGEAEQRRHWEQFEKIASGTGGRCYRLEDAQMIVERIRVIMETQTATVHTRSMVLDALGNGKTNQQICAEAQLDTRAVVSVMEFLEGAGVEIDRLAPDTPSFATGWCLAEVQGVPILEQEVFLARAELDLLLSEMNRLCMHLQPETARLAFQIGLGSRVNPMSWFAERSRPEPLDVWLLSKGVPCSQGILKLTRAEIDSMSEDRRLHLRERIARTVIPALTNARNTDRLWRYFSSDIEMGWIPEALLP